ncbi:MAG: hypothetical protein IPJ41_12580 [Phycisphaerales bacterium]|nr:hypothetical protein [Phycisphaerales bacterium]
MRWCRTHALAVLALSGALAGCSYEKTVYRRPMLSGLPGVISGGDMMSEKPMGYQDPRVSQDGRITIDRGDGSKVLVARSARDLMAHIYSTLKADQRDVFTAQVLCDATRQEFVERGFEPGEAFAYLKEHEGEVAALFGRMPGGEYTPGVVLRQISGNVYRVALSPKAAEGLNWCGFDMVWEGGRMETEGGDDAPQVTVPTLEEAVKQTGSVSGATALIADAKARQPRHTFIQSGWKLRWFVPTPPKDE